MNSKEMERILNDFLTKRARLTEINIPTKDVKSGKYNSLCFLMNTSNNEYCKIEIS